MAERQKKTIPLAHPIELGDRTFAELTLREPLMGDFAAMDAAEGPVGKSLRLVAQCAGVLPKVVDRMHPDDYAKCQAFLAPFAAIFLAAQGGDVDDEGEGEAGPAV